MKSSGSKAKVLGLPNSHPPRVGEVLLGTVVPVVDDDVQRTARAEVGPVTAGGAVLLRAAEAAREAPLARGAPGDWVVTALVRAAEELGEHARASMHVRVDGQTLVLNAAERIELRCGGSVIVLTRDGKILVKGTD